MSMAGADPGFFDRGGGGGGSNLPRKFDKRKKKEEERGVLHACTCILVF